MSHDVKKEEPLPHCLRLWDNKARLSLPPGLLAWLAVLVTTFLCSAIFAGQHRAARWALGGFVVSHLIVLALSLAKSFTLRIGIVSLTHVTCWTPGLVLAVVEVLNGGANGFYEFWLYAIIVVTSISFLFDLRDAGGYLFSRQQQQIERFLQRIR
jgi:hypothetical protein